MLTTDFFLKHRAQDFEYLFNGIITVMEQQTEIVKYILPGAKKSLPYVTETSEPGAISSTLQSINLSTVILFWKLIELNKVSTFLHLPSIELIQLSSLEILQFHIGI